MATIRLIGPHHSRRSTVLTIGDETAAHNSPNIVTLEHARNLVAYGVAEWVASHRMSPTIDRPDAEPGLQVPSRLEQAAPI
jgi:hypothetical protein